MQADKKVLIVNFGSSKNKGSYALLLGQIKMLEKAGVARKNIYVAAFEKEGLSGLNVVDNPVGMSLGEWKKIFLFFISFLYFLLVKLGFKNPTFVLNKDAKRFRDYFAVVNTGGDILSGSYSALGSFINLLNLYIPYFLGARVIFLGETLGRFKNIIVDFLLKNILLKSSAIFVRENRTKEILRHWGISKRVPIIDIPDPAFLLKPVAKKEAVKLLRQEGCPFEENFIGISLSNLIYKYLDKNEKTKKQYFISQSAQFVDWLIENSQKNVLFVSHVVWAKEDDRDIHQEVFKKIKNKKQAFVLKGDYHPEEVKGIIALADVFIGCRMHALIAATSSFVPSVAISYSHKVEGVIGDFMGLGEYILSIKDYSSANLKRSFLKIDQQDKEKLRRQLKIRSQQAQRLIADKIKFLKQVLS